MKAGWRGQCWLVNECRWHSGSVTSSLSCEKGSSGLLCYFVSVAMLPLCRKRWLQVCLLMLSSPCDWLCAEVLSLADMCMYISVHLPCIGVSVILASIRVGFMHACVLVLWFSFCNFTGGWEIFLLISACAAHPFSQGIGQWWWGFSIFGYKVRKGILLSCWLAEAGHMLSQ